MPTSLCIFISISFFFQKLSSGSLVIKVEPSDHDGAGLTELFMRVHFDYNPNQDRLIPSQDAGLSFRKGDILKVLNQEDSFWWQAMRVGEHQVAGLIPSLILEERSVNIASCSPLTSIACFLPSNHYHTFTFSLFPASLSLFLLFSLPSSLLPPFLRSLPLFLSPSYLTPSSPPGGKPTTTWILGLWLVVLERGNRSGGSCIPHTIVASLKPTTSFSMNRSSW